jgi:hypothetical protein
MGSLPNRCEFTKQTLYNGAARINVTFYCPLQIMDNMDSWSITSNAHSIPERETTVEHGSKHYPVKLSKEVLAECGLGLRGSRGIVHWEGG